jgi:hypothetical protein
MLRAIHRLPDGGDVAGHAGGGLVVDDEHALDPVRHVVGQRLLDPFDRRAFAPLDVEYLHVQTDPLGQVDPEMTELPVSRRQDPITRRERVSF